MARTRKTRQFSGLDFATRTAIAWIGAWLPLWILFDAIDVEIPLFLLPVVIVLAVVLKASGYTSVKTRRVLRVALAVGVAAAVLILH